MPFKYVSMKATTYIIEEEEMKCYLSSPPKNLNAFGDMKWIRCHGAIFDWITANCAILVFDMDCIAWEIKDISTIRNILDSMQH